MFEAHCDLAGRKGLADEAHGIGWRVIHGVVSRREFDRGVFGIANAVDRDCSFLGQGIFLSAPATSMLSVTLRSKKSRRRLVMVRRASSGVGLGGSTWLLSSSFFASVTDGISGAGASAEGLDSAPVGSEAVCTEVEVTRGCSLAGAGFASPSLGALASSFGGRALFFWMPALKERSLIPGLEALKRCPKRV